MKNRIIFTAYLLLTGALSFGLVANSALGQAAPTTQPQNWPAPAAVDRPATLPPSVQQLSAAMPESIRQWLDQLLSEKRKDQSTSANLRELLAKENVGVFQLVPLAQTVAFVDGIESALPLTELVLSKTRSELVALPPGDPVARPLVDVLWPLQELLHDTEHWGRTERHKQEQQLLELLRPWEIRGSGHSQLMNYIYAENLYMQQRYTEAYAAFENVLEERKIAFEPSQGINRSLDWELALCLYYTRQYAKAAEHFVVMTQNKGVPEGALSWGMAAAAYAKAGNVEQADKTLDEWIKQRKPAVADVAPVLRLIEHARTGETESIIYTGPTAASKLEKVNQIVADLTQKLSADPRGSVAQIYKDRSVDPLIGMGASDSAAELALRCLNGQPDRVDRAEYFLAVRVKALLAAKKYPQALAAAKSYYNACYIKTTPKAIELLAQCIAAAYPNEPGKARRFKLQQLCGPEDQSLGESILKQIKVDPALYDGAGLQLEHSREWKALGEANLLLMRDQPEAARDAFDPITRSSNAEVASAARMGIARAIKAQTGLVVPANEYLKTVASQGVR